MLHYSSLDQTGVKLITPASTVFMPLLRNRIKEAAMSTIQPLIPYSVIIKNESQRPVVAIVLIWSYKNEQGKPITNTIVHYSLVKDKRMMLNVGDAWILTPVHAANQAMQSGRSEMIGRANMKRQQEIIAQFSTQSDITVSLDSVIFEDGQLAGPDIALTAAYMNGMLRAQRELEDALRAMPPDRFQQLLSDGADAAVAEMRPATVSSPSPSAYEQYWYQKTLKSACKNYLTAIGSRVPDIDSLQKEARLRPAVSFIPEIRRIP